MIFIKRIITIITSILGAAVGIVSTGLFNWSLHLGLSFGNVLLYGIGGGILFGIIAGYIATYYLINKTRRFIINKVSSLFRLNITRR